LSMRRATWRQLLSCIHDRRVLFVPKTMVTTLGIGNTNFHSSSFALKKKFDSNEYERRKTKHMFKELEAIEKHIDLLIQNNKMEDALTFIQSEIDRKRSVRNPNRLMIAYLLVQLGKFYENFVIDLNEAEKAYAEAEKLHPDQPLIVFSYACLLQKRYQSLLDAGNENDQEQLFENAINCLRRCIKLDSSLSEAKHKLAKLLITYDFNNNDSMKEAESLLRAAIDNSYCPSYYLLAEYFTEKASEKDMTLMNEALVLIEKFITLVSNNKGEITDEEHVELIDGYQLKGKILVGMKRFEEAEKVYYEIIEKIDPLDLSSHLKLSYIREAMGKLDDALEGISKIYLQIKNTKDSEVTDERELSLRYLIQFNLAHLYDKLNQPKKSEYLVRNLLSRMESEDFYISLAYFIARQGRTDESRRLLDSIIVKHPEYRARITEFYPKIATITIVPSKKDAKST
jgi:tetratricopeptide (TPR) repeat protein